MAVNSPQPTLFCVIIVCVCLFSLYDQYPPLLVFAVILVIVVAVIVFGYHLLGIDCLVNIALGTIICLPERGAGMGGMSFV